jgi:hypothetical protein
VELDAQSPGPALVQLTLFVLTEVKCTEKRGYWVETGRLIRSLRIL